MVFLSPSKNLEEFSSSQNKRKLSFKFHSLSLNGRLRYLMDKRVKRSVNSQIRYSLTHYKMGRDASSEGSILAILHSYNLTLRIPLIFCSSRLIKDAFIYHDLNGHASSQYLLTVGTAQSTMISPIIILSRTANRI